MLALLRVATQYTSHVVRHAAPPSRAYTAVTGAADSIMASRSYDARGEMPAADSIIHVSSTMNNVHVTVSDLEGAVVSRSSGGMTARKHRARATPQAAAAATNQAVAKAVAKGHRASHLQFKGPSRGRGQVLQEVIKAGIRVLDIRDVTPTPTKGCRPPHARRL